jgi:hypothetical protein
VWSVWHLLQFYTEHKLISHQVRITFPSKTIIGQINVYTTALSWLSLIFETLIKGRRLCENKYIQTNTSKVQLSTSWFRYHGLAIMIFAVMVCFQGFSFCYYASFNGFRQLSSALTTWFRYHVLLTCFLLNS